MWLPVLSLPRPRKINARLTAALLKGFPPADWRYRLRHRRGRFHLDGTRNTPKDMENIEIIDTLITSASNCFIQMAQNLQLRTVLASDPTISAWYRQALDI
jgi:hypothetical protein